LLRSVLVPMTLAAGRYRSSDPIKFAPDIAAMMTITRPTTARVLVVLLNT
jgi:hypothetical protein